MQASLREFMHELIDYAGLFPPARLDLDTAIRNYALYRRGRDAWMLGRFIIPANRLHELGPYKRDLFVTDEKTFRFSVLAGGGTGEKLALDRLREDARRVTQFLEEHGDAVRVETLELRLPEETFEAGDPSRTADVLREWADTIALEGLAGREVYVEMGGPGDSAGAIGTALEGLAEARETVLGHASAGSAETAGGTQDGVGLVGDGLVGDALVGDELAGDALASDGLAGDARVRDARAGDEPACRLGAKLRCGGVEGSTFPTPQQVVHFMDTCHRLGLPLKCTAGLHHPVRHDDAGLNMKMHGFLNVFGAGLLAFARDLPLSHLDACVLEEEPDSFSFTSNTFAWRNHAIDDREIAIARRSFMTSFGSCSFDEPREDLRGLNLLG